VTITAEERQVLEDCYRCPCSGCTRRRELIAKVLGALDAERAAHARTQHWLEEFQGQAAAGTIAGMQMRQRVTTAMENPLTVEAIRGAVLEALAPPVERTPVRSYASEEDWYNDGCPAEAVIRSTP
jgi:hypothetical protein